MVAKKIHRRLPCQNQPQIPRIIPAHRSCRRPRFRPSAAEIRIPHTPSTLFQIAPDIDTETLLASACESLVSASILAGDLAVFVDGPQRSMLLGIQQIIMLADLAVNRALDNLVPAG